MAKRIKKVKKDEPFNIKDFVVKNLRSAFRKTPMYREAKSRAKEEYFGKSKHGKDVRRVRFICAQCQGRFYDRKGAKEIAVDHIQPVVSLEDGFENLHIYAQRLFCSVDNLQVLCNYKGVRNGTKSCHKIKTAEERRLAAEFRKDKKNGDVVPQGV